MGRARLSSARRLRVRTGPRRAADRRALPNSLASPAFNHTLRGHGWCFKIATAGLFAYDPESNHFEPLGGVGPPKA